MVSLSTAKTANKRLWLVVFVCHLPEEHEVPLWGEGKSGGNSVTVRLKRFVRLQVCCDGGKSLP